MSDTEPRGTTSENGAPTDSDAAGRALLKEVGDLVSKSLASSLQNLIFGFSGDLALGSVKAEEANNVVGD
ncbi:hypothetical protein CR51_26300 [Caballeronia megalochromosomata]|nr:hypothetical protein CR51_26300 [Caballeronia megalochromosomata]